MSGFQLAQLQLHLLEKVITKVDEKSYFRLRMANKGVTGFIRRSRNISVHLHGRFILEHIGGGSWEFRSANSIVIKIDVDALLGIRLQTLLSPFFLDSLSGKHGTDSSKALENLCNILKKNRITSGKAGIFMGDWTTEQYWMLLKILTPLEVVLGNEEATRDEALFHLKQLRKVDARVDEDEAVVVTRRLLSTFSEVTIRVMYPWPNHKLQSLRTILQTLCSHPWPNLRKFDFFALSEDWSLPSTDELEEYFHGYNLTKVEIISGDDKFGEDVGEEEISISMEPPQHTGANCNLVIRGSYFTASHLSFIR